MIKLEDLSGYTTSFITGGDIKYKVEEVTDRFIIGSYSPIGKTERYTCVHNRNGININKNVDGIRDLYRKANLEEQLECYKSLLEDVVNAINTILAKS